MMYGIILASYLRQLGVLAGDIFKHPKTPDFTLYLVTLRARVRVANSVPKRNKTIKKHKKIKIDNSTKIGVVYGCGTSMLLVGLFVRQVPRRKTNERKRCCRKFYC
tara:strand:- start:1071 stop:1388 length:318 start_codon:yes stop_codon:yes gene_type:complete